MVNYHNKQILLMKNKLKINNVLVNGISVDISSSKKVLSAIEKTGFSVPKLCYDERSGPRGTCRMCLVEVTNNNKTSIVFGSFIFLLISLSLVEFP